jgi:hypothetical protein
MSGKDLLLENAGISARICCFKMQGHLPGTAAQDLLLF